MGACEHARGGPREGSGPRLVGSDRRCSPLHGLQGCCCVRPEVTRKLMNVECLCLICAGFVAWSRSDEAPVGRVQVSKTVIGLSARPGPVRERIAAPKTAENCGARTSLEGCNTLLIPSGGCSWEKRPWARPARPPMRRRTVCLQNQPQRENAGAGESTM